MCREISLGIRKMPESIKKNSRKIRVAWFIPEQARTKFSQFFGYTTLLPNLVLPSVWIRAHQIARYLSASQFEVQYNTTDPKPDIAVFLRRYSADDYILVQKLKRKGIRIVVDVVANYFQMRERHPEGYGGASREQVSSFLKIVESADQVWTVSPNLKELSRELNPEAYFVSDSVDPVHFNPLKYLNQKRYGRVELGWSGTTEKAKELDEISPILNRFIRGERIKVQVITRKRPKLSFDFNFKRWDYNSFPQMISSCDLCIAPRRIRDDYDLGHSLFKIGVFMAMGVPALAGPVPSYNLLLEDGEAGAICQSMDEWQFHLERFVEDEPARLAAGSVAIEKMQPFMTPTVAAQVSQLLQKNLEI